MRDVEVHETLPAAGISDGVDKQKHCLRQEHHDNSSPPHFLAKPGPCTGPSTPGELAFALAKQAAPAAMRAPFAAVALLCAALSVDGQIMRRLESRKLYTLVMEPG